MSPKTTKGKKTDMQSQIKEEGDILQEIALTSDQQEEFKKKIAAVRNRSGNEAKPGVVYLGRIPHGFYELQMKGYFSQFGTVNKIRIARSKRTGKIKGYAFIEFAHEEVAKIVADSMKNYLMFHRLLRCEFVPEDKVHPETFKGHDRPFSKPKAHIVSNQRHNSVKSAGKLKSNNNRLKKKLGKKLQKIADMGINYEFEVPEPASVNIVVEDSSDEDIDFKTPPRAFKSSRLSMGISVTPEGLPKPLLTEDSPKKSDTPKRKSSKIIISDSAPRSKVPTPALKRKPVSQQAQSKKKRK